MRRRVYDLEPGNMLTRGKSLVEIITTAGNMASVMVLRDHHGSKASKRAIVAMRLWDLAEFWEVAA